MEHFPKIDQVIGHKEKILIYSKLQKPSKSYSEYSNEKGIHNKRTANNKTDHFKILKNTQK